MAGSELCEEALDPLPGSGKVMEYFVCWFLIPKARMFVFCSIHSVSPLLSNNHPAPSQQDQATRCCSHKDTSREQLRIPAHCTFGLNSLSHPGVVVQVEGAAVHEMGASGVLTESPDGGSHWHSTEMGRNPNPAAMLGL